MVYSAFDHYLIVDRAIRGAATNVTNQSLMERLKEDTRQAHDSAEGSKLQSELANGTIPLETYKQYLGQIYLIHRALERGIKSNIANCPIIRNSLSDSHYQESFLSSDLSALGVKGEEIKPMPSTRAVMEKIEKQSRECPAALLGYHYVLLGSKHGGKYVAKRLQERFNFEDGIGCKYFDPYGQTFMPLWLEFKKQMNESECSDNEQEQIICAAREMFGVIQQMCVDLESVSCNADRSN